MAKQDKVGMALIGIGGWGGIIGSAVGHPAAGAAIGGGLGLGAGALSPGLIRAA